MSVGLYDEALLKKLKNWTSDTNLSIYGPQETKRMFQAIADKTNDAPLKLPIISLRRPGGFTVLNTNKKPMTFDGLTLEANHEVAKQLNAIPIGISYQLDIYTRYFEEADQYARNIVFNIINYPKVDVIIPYNNEDYVHHSNIRMNPEVEDNSDIPERLIPGQFTRLSLKIDIDDAYLWDVRYRDVYSIDIKYEIEDD
jgi:hypothetical protein